MNNPHEEESPLDLAVMGKADEASSVLLLLPPSPPSAADALRLVEPLAEEFKTLVLTSALPQPADVEQYAARLERALQRARIKRVTVCGIEAGGSVAQALALASPKLVRRIVLIDAATRLKPGKLVRFIDRVERFLPLGLPLRLRTSDYDSRPFLHRIHCPALILVTHGRGRFVREQAAFIARRVPNSWLAELTSEYRTAAGAISGELADLLAQFLQVPVKRPQKRSAEAAAAAR